MEHFHNRYGIAAWELIDMAARFGAQSPIRFLANAYAQDVMVELIEPLSGAPSIYQNWTPAEGSGIRFHHLGFLIRNDEEWDAARATLAADNIAIASEGDVNGLLKYLYADTVDDLGHYFELVYPQPGASAFFANIPRN